MEKQWPIVPLLVGLIMIAVGISLSLAHIGVGDIHEGVVMGKGISPPYWENTHDTFLLIDEGSNTHLVLPVDASMFASTEIGDSITWEDHSLIDAYLWALGIVGFVFLMVGVFALIGYSDW